jgi:hypothetical protein
MAPRRVLKSVPDQRVRRGNTLRVGQWDGQEFSGDSADKLEWWG